MKIYKFIITLISFTFLFTSAFAENKIATLDVVQLLKDSKAAISMKDQLNVVAKKFTEEDQKTQKEIQKQEEKYPMFNQSVYPRGQQFPSECKFNTVFEITS